MTTRRPTPSFQIRDIGPADRVTTVTRKENPLDANSHR